MFAKNVILPTFILLKFILFSACSETMKSEEGIDYESVDQIIYSTHIQPLLNELNKILLKNDLYPPGLQMNSWENLIKGWQNGEVIIPFDSENSLLIELHEKTELTDRLEAVKINFLKRWIDEGAQNDSGQIPYQDSEQLLYVCSQSEAIINIIDIKDLVVVRNVKLTDFGLPASAKPHHIAFSPDGKYFFVSCIDNQVNKILKIDRKTNQLIAEAATDIPALLAHHPTENILYISRFMLNNATTSVYVLNTENMQPVETGNHGEIFLPPGLTIPHAMAINPNGQFIYTCSFTEDQFIVINHSTKTFTDALYLGNDRTPLQCAVSPDGEKVYISCIGTGEVVVINVSDNENIFLETALSLGGQPWHGDFNKSGDRFFVGNFALNNVALINTKDFTVQTIGIGDGSDGLSQPHGLAVSPGEDRAFVSCRNTSGNYKPYFDFGDNDRVGTVVVIDLLENSIEKVIEIENFGSGTSLWSN